MKLKAALRYVEHYGFSVIPCSQKKKPYVKWEKFQKEKPSLEQIRQWWAEWPQANPAIVTGHISGVCVIDVDKEDAMEELNKYIPETLQMPISTTPGGGKHLWFSANGNCLRNHAGIIQGVDFRGEGGYIMAPPSEAWSEHGEEAKFGKYVWQVSIKECSLPSLPNIYIKHITNSVLYNNIYNISKINAKPAGLFKQGRRDDDLFHISHCLVKGGASHEHIQQVIEILADNCDPPMPKKEAWEKVQSALNRDDRKCENLSLEVRDYVMSTSGHFMSTDVHNMTQVSTRRDKKNVSEILRRLVNEGIIERYGDKNGSFRLVEKECQEINWIDASTDTFSITLPLFLNELVQIMPKNITIVAGAPDSGKTAFLLNVAENNLRQHKDNIFYFSSEMGPSELKKRLKGFETGIETWKGVKFFERSDNFADVIRPDAINIIDYLELSDKFWLIAEKLMEIHKKLNRGICFIGLQKNPGVESGRGGTFGLEKPRLYLSLDRDYPYNKMKIIKAKNWSHDVCPNGMVKRFKIVNGCKLIQNSEWERNVK